MLTSEQFYLLRDLVEEKQALTDELISSSIGKALQSKGYINQVAVTVSGCLLYTSPSPRDGLLSRMPSSA